MPIEPSKKLLVAFGPVSMVKPIPSREVSVISVEIPEEFHIAVTNLLYGRDALVTLSSLQGAKYGILDPENDQSTGHAASHAEIRAVHGSVAGVRAVPSRDISIVSIEVPEDAHVEVTQMLYGKDVLIMPSTLASTTPRTPYGVIRNAASGTAHAPNPHAGSAAGQRGGVAPQARSPMPGARPSGMFHIPAPVDIVKWVGARCSEDAFQDFLGVRNEAQAIQAVRERCGVESRRELATNQAARRIFMNTIYAPYRSTEAA